MQSPQLRQRLARSGRVSIALRIGTARILASRIFSTARIRMRSAGRKGKSLGVGEVEALGRIEVPRHMRRNAEVRCIFRVELVGEVAVGDGLPLFERDDRASGQGKPISEDAAGGAGADDAEFAFQ